MGKNSIPGIKRSALCPDKESTTPLKKFLFEDFQVHRLPICYVLFLSVKKMKRFAYVYPQFLMQELQ